MWRRRLQNVRKCIIPSKRVKYVPSFSFAIFYFLFSLLYALSTWFVNWYFDVFKKKSFPLEYSRCGYGSEPFYLICFLFLYICREKLETVVSVIDVYDIVTLFSPWFVSIPFSLFFFFVLEKYCLNIFTVAICGIRLGFEWVVKALWSKFALYNFSDAVWNFFSLNASQQGWHQRDFIMFFARNGESKASGWVLEEAISRFMMPFSFLSFLGFELIWLQLHSALIIVFRCSVFHMNEY